MAWSLPSKLLVQKGTHQLRVPQQAVELQSCLTEERAQLDAVGLLAGPAAHHPELVLAIPQQPEEDSSRTGAEQLAQYWRHFCWSLRHGTEASVCEASMKTDAGPFERHDDLEAQNFGY